MKKPRRLKPFFGRGTAVVPASADAAHSITAAAADYCCALTSLTAGWASEFWVVGGGSAQAQSRNVSRQTSRNFK